MSVHEIRTALFKSIEWTYTSPGQAPDVLGLMQKWRMIDARSGQFEFHGNLSGLGGNGQAFRIVDVTDSDMPGRDAGFRGAIISFKQANHFEGRTIIKTDMGVYNPTTVDLMQRVPFSDDKFEHIFEVYSDHSTEAEALFTSGLVKKLTNFSRETLGRKIQACCLGDEIHFALDIDDNFSFSKGPKQKNASKFVRELVVEAGSICVILEQLYCIQASLGRADTAEEKQKRLAYYKKCLSKMMDTANSLTATAAQQGEAA